MRKETLGWAILIMLAVLLLAVGCGDDPATPKGGGNEPPVVTNLPAIPVPKTENDLMPATSDTLIIGMSKPLERFEPVVTQLRRRLDDGSYQWFPINRRLIMACPGVLPVNTCDLAAADPTYISERPYLLHSRFWRRLEQNNLSPGTSYTLTKEVTYGVSSTHTESVEFSETMGIGVSGGAGWGPFSLGISASYEQTTTETEINSVTVMEETTETREYTVEAPTSGTRVYVLWQLVDMFAFVDADTVPVHLSPILTHIEMPAVANINLPNKDVVTMKTTDFD